MERTGGSRLMQMQARFQQKQMQERENKIASLYEAQQARALDRVRHSPGNGVATGSGSPSPPASKPPPAVHHPGKVRQMFEERRTKAGIDKSYPLQPIHNTERTVARKALPNGYTKVSTSTTNSRVSVEKKTRSTTSTHSVQKRQNVQKVDKIENIVNGSGDLNHNHEPDLNTSKPHSRSNGNLISNIDELDNNYLLENETFPEALAPVPTPRSPEPKRPPRRQSPTKTKPQPAVAPPRRVTSEQTHVSGSQVSRTNQARGAMQRVAGYKPVPRKPSTNSSTAKGRSPTGSAPGDGVPCSVCGRRFADDRLAKHEDICKKSRAKKRKPFDALKHRLAGTEAEPFINKLRKGTPSTTKVSKPLNNNWRQKHEEFISAIRAAKQVQNHLKAGGKLSDLPPPPPSENPDYVQCPHCNRRFNQAAAERHIPKCANFQFNKPKPAARRR